MDIIKAIFLGFKLLPALINKPLGFRDKLSLKSWLKMRLWNTCLYNYIKELKTYVNFSCTSEQQKEIIFHITRIAILVEEEFDSKSSVLTSENFRDVVLGKVSDKDTKLFIISQKVHSSINRIKELISNGLNYDSFLEKIIETWETHKIRDVKEYGINASEKERMQSSEDRGGFYFLALAFALNPINLTSEYQDVIYYCGAWFQITDDYKDFNKDWNIKNTPFTINKNKPLKSILKKIQNIYKDKIKKTIPEQNTLVGFMEKLCVLLLKNPF